MIDKILDVVLEILFFAATMFLIGWTKGQVDEED